MTDPKYLLMTANFQKNWKRIRFTKLFLRKTETNNLPEMLVVHLKMKKLLQFTLNQKACTEILAPHLEIEKLLPLKLREKACTAINFPEFLTPHLKM